MNSITKIVNQVHRYDSRNANRDMETSRQVWQYGYQEEMRIKKFLLSLGFNVTNSSKHENIFEDIDCWVGETPISIKAMHKSLQYPGATMCFELEQRLTGTDVWEKSWYYNGKAEKYLILQGTRLALVDKQELVDHVDRVGFDYKRTLKPSTRSYCGGSARYDDSRCGFIPQLKVPTQRTWVLPWDFARTADSLAA